MRLEYRKIRLVDLDLIFMLSEVTIEFFFGIRSTVKLGPKIHCLALKLYTGFSKSGGA